MRYAACMRYAQGGGLTDERRAFREKLRLEAAEWFQSGDENVIIAQVVGESGLE
ncbi:UNVERIFIED_CONTAM: hypothetical protein RKD50_009237 [Streptomyces canus]